MKLRFDIDGAPLELSLHAVERYAERVKSLPNPTMDELRRVAQEIVSVLAIERRLCHSLPEWIETPLSERVAAKQADTYMLVGDDIAFPVKYRDNGTPILVTCLTRGVLSPQARNRRNERKQKRRARARERRQLESWLGDRNRKWN
jgi:hypothetical protein